MRSTPLALAAALGCLAAAAPAAGAAVRLVPVGDPVHAPVWVGAPTGAKGLYAVDQEGVILRLVSGTWRPFLDLRDRVRYGGEQGLLSVAFHPRYAKNRLFYVNYTGKDGGATHVVEFRANRTRTAGLRSTARQLIRIAQPYENHNGGQLQFGPDGMLWIGMGDGGSGGDPENRAQNPRALLGKILRLDVDGRRPYGIPAGNAFPGGRRGRAEIWALGLRNPWRFSFDRTTGDLWIGDVGQGAWEEIDRVTRASLLDQSPRRNFGWKVWEGTHRFSTGTRAGMTFPVHEYAHGDDGCSVTGGVVYRGTAAALARVRGRYVFADYCSSQVWTLHRSKGRWARTLLATVAGLNPTAFGESGDGRSLYVASQGQGRILRIASVS